MNDNMVQIGLYFFVMAFGLYYVAAFIFRWTMYLPGGMFKPGRDSIGRLFILLLGVVMASWAGNSLLNEF